MENPFPLAYLNFLLERFTPVNLQILCKGYHHDYARIPFVSW
jgi:hypothetical protein